MSLTLNMLRKQTVILTLLLLLFSIPSYANEARDSEVVEKFGVGFNEIVIADSSDFLSDPRDLEFHPGRTNELWIANRATDSICLLYTSPSPRDRTRSRMPSSA